jgi:prepilin-type N-terminal cleavage/methylation domain-containing protein
MQAGRAGGFTLIELSVVVMVVALLLGSLLVPLTTQVEQRNVSETQKRLQEVRDALIGYAIVNGRFPCPAVSTGASTDTGTEQFSIPLGGNKANGICANFNGGFVPGATLGLSNLDSQGFVVDAWGLQQNRIRYAISDTAATGISHLFTASNGMRNSGIINASGVGVTFLNVCSATPPGAAPFTSCGTAPLLSNEVVFVVYSLGKNAATGGTSADEAANLDGDVVFVSRTNYSQAGGEYDDLLLWASRPAVVGQLASAGQLP